jgi:uncharacterized protein (DUF1499 family)
MKNLNLNKQELKKLITVVKEQNVYSVSSFRTDNMLKFIDDLEDYLYYNYQ